MSQIQITAKFKIHDGQLDRFKALAKECIDLVETHEMSKGCFQYDWFLKEDGKEAVVRETYQDSDAFLVHLQNVGAQLAQLGEISDLTAELCGYPSRQLKDALDALEVTYYTPL